MRLQGMAMAAALALGLYGALGGPGKAAEESAPPGFVTHDAPREIQGESFRDADGATLSLADFKGRVVLLNLWATWCGPCREEMPALDRLNTELGGEAFEVVAVSLDRGGLEAARAFLDEIGVESLKLYNDETMRFGRSLRAFGLPTTILIDAEGREIGRLVGPAEWDSEEAKALIRRHLPDPAETPTET